MVSRQILPQVQKGGVKKSLQKVVFVVFGSYLFIFSVQQVVLQNTSYRTLDLMILLPPKQKRYANH